MTLGTLGLDGVAVLEAVVTGAPVAHRRVLGPDHPLVATTIQNLAMTDHQNGNLESARELYERALAMMESDVCRRELLFEIELDAVVPSTRI